MKGGGMAADNPGRTCPDCKGKGYIDGLEIPGGRDTCVRCDGSGTLAPATAERAAVILPRFGSAYTLEGADLLQHPLLADGRVDWDGGGAVDWERGLETLEDRAELEVVRDALAQLSTLEGIRAVTEVTPGMTLRELLDHLDGNGLTMTDDNLILDALNVAGLELDDVIRPSAEEVMPA
jgi:hypothetical protein